MDKVKIKFKSRENGWKYQLRIPEDLEWFEICRYYKTKEKDMYIYMYVHEEIMFYCFAYYNIENRKFEISLSEEEKDDYIVETACDLVSSLGINKFTLEILSRLDINIKPFIFKNIFRKKPYNFKNMFLEKEKYYLSKCTKNDKYQFDLTDLNGNVLGYYSNWDENIDLLVLPNQMIKFDSLLNDKEHVPNVIKSLVKRR